MAIDKREQVLLQLLVILGTVSGFIGTHRNRVIEHEIDPETKLSNLPAVVLLDGKEVKVGNMGKSVGGQMPPALFTLMPQVWILLQPRDTTANEGVGEELSAFRVKVLKAIFTDQTLNALLGANGSMEYRGCDTDMQTGSTIEGQMMMDFGFNYVLNPINL